MNNRLSLKQWFVAAVLRLPPRKLHRCVRLIGEHGLGITFDSLVAHHMAGGRIDSWIEGLIYARERGIELEVMNAAARDLIAAHGSKITLTKHIRDAERAGFREMSRVPFDTLQAPGAKPAAEPDSPEARRIAAEIRRRIDEKMKQQAGDPKGR